MQNSESSLSRRRHTMFNLKPVPTLQTKNLSFSQDQPTQNDSPVKKRLRKGSMNLKTFNNIDLRREVSIKQSFQECYELGPKIGQGGHSVVYKCKHLQSHQTFAVKVTRKNDPQNLLGLKEQYRILMSLKHQSILKGYFLYLNEKKSTCYLVCDYSEAPDLRYHMIQKKKNNQIITEQQVAKIMKKIILAVNYMHQKKICHRDLKPDNILYDQKTQKIKIIDFEVAKMPRYTHEKLEMWTKTGTPSHRSPELISGSYGVSTDMWSIGIIAYQMLTGKFPFKVSSYQSELFNEILNFEPKWNDLGISKCAVSFLERLLKKNPKQRMTSRQALKHPFLFSLNIQCPERVKLRKLPSSNSFQIIDSKDSSEDQEVHSISPKSRYYDQSNTYSFWSNTDKDIGIRFCQE